MSAGAMVVTMGPRSERYVCYTGSLQRAQDCQVSMLRITETFVAM